MLVCVFLSIDKNEWKISFSKYTCNHFQGSWQKTAGVDTVSSRLRRCHGVIEYFWENKPYHQKKENIFPELTKIEPKNKVFNRVGCNGRDEILSVLVEKKILTKAVVDNYYIEDYERSSFILLTREPGFHCNRRTKDDVELYRYATEHMKDKWNKILTQKQYTYVLNKTVLIFFKFFLWFGNIDGICPNFVLFRTVKLFSIIENRS